MTAMGSPASTVPRAAWAQTRTARTAIPRGHLSTVAVAVALAAAACRDDAPVAGQGSSGSADPAAAAAADPGRAGSGRAPGRPASSALPPHHEHDTLAAAVTALITPATRLIGLGELHSRVDRPGAPSTLRRFTDEILPALPARTRDLVLETWTVDPRCGKAGAVTTAKLEAATRRPAATKNELGILVDTSRLRGIRAHPMRVTCEDYAAMAGGDDDAIVHMLDLTTAELARLANTLLTRAAAPAPAPERSPTPPPPPLVVLYGGALHNDRFPTDGLSSWSYSALVEAASERTYLEIDLIAPELAEGDPALAAQPWAPLLGASSRVVTYRRGERSYVIVLPRATAAAAPESGSDASGAAASSAPPR